MAARLGDLDDVRLLCKALRNSCSRCQPRTSSASSTPTSAARSSCRRASRRRATRRRAARRLVSCPLPLPPEQHLIALLYDWPVRVEQLLKNELLKKKKKTLHLQTPVSSRTLGRAATIAVIARMLLCFLYFLFCSSHVNGESVMFVVLAIRRAATGVCSSLR